MAAQTFRFLLCFFLVIYHTETKPATSQAPKCYYLPACAKEEHSLDITCGYPYIQFMKKFEDQLIAYPEFHDYTRCLYNKNLDINEVDFVVIGAGVAGSVVANRLTEIKDWNVMLLELGGAAASGSQVPSMYFNYQQDPDVDFSYKLEPQSNVCLNTNGICTYPRGKVMGGTGVLHGMMYMRGNAYDYDILKNDGIEGWSFKDVFPYFLKSENNLNLDADWIDKPYHRAGGLLTVARFNHYPKIAETILDGWHGLGYPIKVDCNGRSQRGFMLAQATTINGTRETTAKAYINRFLDRPNLYVLPKSQAILLDIDKENLVVKGVVYARHGRRRYVKVRKEVVLAAGTINSPQLMLISGLGPKKDLENIGVGVVKDIPGVGRNLNNHVSTELFFRVNSEVYTQDLNLASIKQYLDTKTGPLSSTGLSQLTGFIKTNENDGDPRPDFQIFHAGYNANCSRTGLVDEESYKGRLFSISPTLLSAKSTGYIKLRNLFPKSNPIIYGGVLTEKEDLDRLLKAIKITLNLVNTDAFKKKNVILDPSPLKGCQDLVLHSDDYWRCYIAHKTNAENHQVGTLRMGAVTDKHAVTDSKLKVIGIQNLRVADPSVLPRTPSANLQAPTIMIAERAGDFIKESWGVLNSVNK